MGGALIPSTLTDRSIPICFNISLQLLHFSQAADSSEHCQVSCLSHGIGALGSLWCDGRAIWQFSLRHVACWLPMRLDLVRFRPHIRGRPRGGQVSRRAQEYTRCRCSCDVKTDPVLTAPINCCLFLAPSTKHNDTSHSAEPATCPYPKSDESFPHPFIYYYYNYNHNNNNYYYYYYYYYY